MYFKPAKKYILQISNIVQPTQKKIVAAISEKIESDDFLSAALSAG